MSRKVLFCGAWDDGNGYPRTRSLQQGLRAQGCDVVECRLPAMGQGKQRLLRQPWRLPCHGSTATGCCLQQLRG